MTRHERFEAVFGRPPDAVASANGRVNLIGEHTDYNDGYVLPMAVPLATRVAVARRPDAVVRLSSRELDLGQLREYPLGSERTQNDWIDYVQGITWVLAQSGHTLTGFDAAIETDLPLGSGLSSSAALEIAMLRVLRTVYGLDLDDLTMARLGQRAEVDFVGARVGIMDQLSASLGDETHALFVDTRSLEHSRVPLPDDVEVVVVNSGVSHSNVAGDYNTRRAECERACALLGVTSLREIEIADLDRVRSLPVPLDRRARHVITENQRVLDTVSALRAGASAELGPLLVASHASMRDDYEVSVPEIDLLVELAMTHPETVGARLTGGGFGGSILVLARRGSGSTIGQAVVTRYRERTGRPGQLLVPHPVSGTVE